MDLRKDLILSYKRGFGFSTLRAGLIYNWDKNNSPSLTSSSHTLECNLGLQKEFFSIKYFSISGGADFYYSYTKGEVDESGSPPNPTYTYSGNDIGFALVLTPSLHLFDRVSISAELSYGLKKHFIKYLGINDSYWVRFSHRPGAFFINYHF